MLDKKVDLLQNRWYYEDAMTIVNRQADTAEAEKDESQRCIKKIYLLYEMHAST
jgi:hypothetical protein